MSITCLIQRCLRYQLRHTGVVVFGREVSLGEICYVEFLPDLDISSFMAGSYMSVFPARQRMGIQFLPFKWEIPR